MFMVFDPETRRVLAEFETREEAEAALQEKIARDPKAEGLLRILTDADSE